MSFLKIKAKLFSKPSKIEESSIDVEVDTTSEEIPESVGEVLREKTKELLVRKVRKELCKICYSEEVVKETEEAIAEFRHKLNDTERVKRIREKYPNALFRKELSGWHSGLMLMGMYVDVDKLCERIVENSGVLDEMKITIDGEEV
jgi:hypothetical protein